MDEIALADSAYPENMIVTRPRHDSSIKSECFAKPIINLRYAHLSFTQHDVFTYDREQGYIC